MQLLVPDIFDNFGEQVKVSIPVLWGLFRPASPLLSLPLSCSFFLHHLRSSFPRWLDGWLCFVRPLQSSRVSL